MTSPSGDYELETDSPAATFAFGRLLGRNLFGGLTLGLVGPLGAGKTHLVKGLAFGNADDQPREVTSPTFTLVQQYPGRLILFHLDAYRLTCPAELVGLGFDELIREDTCVVVEWADRVRKVLPPDTLWIEITSLDESRRRFVARIGGESSRRFLDSIRE